MSKFTLTEEGSNPSTPASGKWTAFFKSDGFYIIDDTGAVTGPFGTGSGSFATNAEAITGTDTTKTLNAANLRAVLATLPRGTMFNLRLNVTVVSNDLVVALKTHAGTDPSATDPGYVRIGNTVRAVTAATSFTLADGTNWFNSGSAELGTKEIDYFAYVVWDSNSSIVAMTAARIPSGNICNDFSSTTTSEKYLVNVANFTGTDEVEVIGRFAATLSLTGTSHVWTVPAFTAINLIQRPIWETRDLDWTPVWTGLTSMTVTSVTVTQAKYQIVHNRLFLEVTVTAFTIGGTPSPVVLNTLPFSGLRAANTMVVGAMLFAENGASGFGGTRLTDASPDQLGWVKPTAANWAAGAGTALLGNGWYKI